MLNDYIIINWSPLTVSPCFCISYFSDWAYSSTTAFHRQREAKDIEGARTTGSCSFSRLPLKYANCLECKNHEAHWAPSEHHPCPFPVDGPLWDSQVKLSGASSPVPSPCPPSITHNITCVLGSRDLGICQETRALAVWPPASQLISVGLVCFAVVV